MERHEEMFIRSFLTARHRQRYLAKRGLPREILWHEPPRMFDQRRSIELASELWGERLRTVLEALTTERAGFCISANRDLDGATIPFDALADIQGTIVSVVPGELAVYQTECAAPATYSYLLVKDDALRELARQLLRGE